MAGRNAVSVDTVGAFLPGFETLGVQHLHQAVQNGLGISYSDPEKEGSPGKLKIAGMPVEEAAKVFQRAAYGKVFSAFE